MSQLSFLINSAASETTVFFVSFLFCRILWISSTPTYAIFFVWSTGSWFHENGDVMSLG